jgi:site-specific recombinase XerD
VTELLKQGWTYEKISKLTGHSSIGTLAAYDHTVASDIAKEARNSISKI